MPYITKDQRQDLDGQIKALAHIIKQGEAEDYEGEMNYIITNLLCQVMKPKDGWRYKWINRAIGVLECVKLEFYRRLVANYEVKAIAKNGDIEVYKE